MGLLSDFFLATADEIQSLDLRSGPSSAQSRVQAKGFDTVQLVSLEAQLRGLADEAVSQPIIAEGDEVTVVALSDEFRDALATMSSADVTEFSEQWLLSNDETIVIGEVAGLARLGQQNRKHLYVWISL